MAGAVVLATSAVATGAVIAQADDSPTAHAAAGGVSLTPQTVEHTAKKGSLGASTIKTTTTHTRKGTVKARPCTQNRTTGAVQPNLNVPLARYVQAQSSAFNLAAGATRVVQIVQRRTPPGGSLYGGIEVFGKPLH